MSQDERKERGFNLLVQYMLRAKRLYRQLEVIENRIVCIRDEYELSEDMDHARRVADWLWKKECEQAQKASHVAAESELSDLQRESKEESEETRG